MASPVATSAEPAYPFESPSDSELDTGGSAVIDVRGMWCTSCANAVERVLARQPGVLDAKVSFTAESAHVQWDPRQTSLARLLEPVARLGYTALPEEASRDRRAHLAREVRALQLRLVVAALFSMWVMLAQWALYLDSAHQMPAAARYGLALFAGATTLPVLFYCGWPFLRAAWRTLRAGAPGMDVLVASGALVAFLLSLWRLLAGSAEVYFDSAAMIISLLLAGRLIEHSIRAKTTDTVRSLLALPAETVSVMDADGSERRVLGKRVESGARVRVRPGERAAIDGVIESGTSTLDRSLLTGESTPVTVAPGDTVAAGSLNGTGALIVRVTAAQGQRRIDAIARAVRQMLARRTASEALAERFTRYLVPLVFIVAVMTFALGVLRHVTPSVAIEHAMAVLIITCPCALGLATPLALMAGAGRAARSGILFQNVEALEKAAHIDTVLFDKTGTLTLGRPTVVGIHAARGISNERLLATAATAGAGSEHPLARAIREAAQTADERIGTPRAIPGQGVVWIGRDADQILVGTRALLEQYGVRSLTEAPQHRDTTVHVAENGQALGYLRFADGARSGAREAIAELSERGMVLAVLTGDRLGPALSIARALGLHPDAIHADQSPEAKAQRILEMRAAGHTVAFVGDGLNDGPALAAADFGIAVQNASATSAAAAAVVLANGGIEKLTEVLLLGRRTAGVMRQNLTWAVGYNLLALPLAVSGVVSPALAAAAMVLSSLSVTLNAWRLHGRDKSERAHSPTSIEKPGEAGSIQATCPCIPRST
jgi:heavy metal translocating P-type ATPase